MVRQHHLASLRSSALLPACYIIYAPTMQTHRASSRITIHRRRLAEHSVKLSTAAIPADTKPGPRSITTIGSRRSVHSPVAVSCTEYSVGPALFADRILRLI